MNDNKGKNINLETEEIQREFTLQEVDTYITSLQNYDPRKRRRISRSKDRRLKSRRRMMVYVEEDRRPRCILMGFDEHAKDAEIHCEIGIASGYYGVQKNRINT